MPRRSLEGEYRERLQHLSSALARFGLVDQFGLAKLFRSAALPSKETVRVALNRYFEVIPSGLSADLVSESILSEMTGDSVYNASDSLNVRQLAKLKPGREDAPAYHELIFQILSICFEGRLENPVKEQPLNDDLKRIDIVFDNVATEGFFAELAKDHSIPSLFVPFECKNYSADPGNPEFDQIAGRLMQRRGMFGCIVCREIEDSKRVLQRCSKIMNEQQKYIVVLEDRDMKEIVRAYRGREQSSIDTVFWGKFRDLLFS